MVNDHFSAFTAHAHTKNELITDPSLEMELRKRNSPEEARRLAEMVLDRVEKSISDAALSLDDAKLLVLYSSYRGETDEKDREICEAVLGGIEKRFKRDTAGNQPRLIGLTTAGEIENEDLLLKDVSGIGYNGLSLLALDTSLPIGVGRTYGLGSQKEAVEQGREMAHEAWVDFNENTNLKEHAEKSKTLFVLTQGPTAGSVQVRGKRGFEHFLGEGIAEFMTRSREARITNVIGGSAGDGLIARIFRIFYGKLGTRSGLKTLNNEAVCALIPNVSEPSIGNDTAPTKRIGKPYTFHFDREAQPEFMDIRRIDKKDPAALFAKVVYENEARESSKVGGPLMDEQELLTIISEFEGIPTNPVVGKYAFAFPFGNYDPVCPIRVIMKGSPGKEERGMDLGHPIRSYEPVMKGYVTVIDCAKVQKGARNVHNALRENRGFAARDITLLVSCVSRRLAEIMAGCLSGTEAEILKEALASTQVLGFLAYGELSFNHLLQEPFHHNFSCWGITFRSSPIESKKRKSRKELGIKDWIKGEN